MIECQSAVKKEGMTAICDYVEWNHVTQHSNEFNVERQRPSHSPGESKRIDMQKWNVAWGSPEAGSREQGEGRGGMWTREQDLSEDEEVRLRSVRAKVTAVKDGGLFGHCQIQPCCNGVQTSDHPVHTLSHTLMQFDYFS